MKAELMGLWGILSFTTLWSIKKLMVAGDCRATIDWINDKSNMDLNYLRYWKENIRLLKKGYEKINFMHITVQQRSRQPIKKGPQGTLRMVIL